MGIKKELSKITPIIIVAIIIIATIIATHKLCALIFDTDIIDVIWMAVICWIVYLAKFIAWEVLSMNIKTHIIDNCIVQTIFKKNLKRIFLSEIKAYGLTKEHVYFSNIDITPDEITSYIYQADHWSNIIIDEYNSELYNDIKIPEPVALSNNIFSSSPTLSTILDIARNCVVLIIFILACITFPIAIILLPIYLDYFARYWHVAYSVEVSADLIETKSIIKQRHVYEWKEFKSYGIVFGFEQWGADPHQVKKYIYLNRGERYNDVPFGLSLIIKNESFGHRFNTVYPHRKECVVFKKYILISYSDELFDQITRHIQCEQRDIIC